MKVRAVIKMVEGDGWYLVATRGSHRQFKHGTKRGRVTISGTLNDDVAPGTLNSVLKQAGLKERNSDLEKLRPLYRRDRTRQRQFLRICA